MRVRGKEEKERSRMQEKGKKDAWPDCRRPLGGTSCANTSASHSTHHCGHEERARERRGEASLAVQIATHFTHFTHSGKLILHTHILVKFNCCFCTLSTVEKGRPVSCGERGEPAGGGFFNFLNFNQIKWPVDPPLLLDALTIPALVGGQTLLLPVPTQHAIQIHSQHTILLTQRLQSEFRMSE